MRLDHRFSVHSLDIEDIEPRSPKQGLVRKLVLLVAGAGLVGLGAHHATQWLQQYTTQAPTLVSAAPVERTEAVTPPTSAARSRALSAEPTETVDSGEVPTTAAINIATVARTEPPKVHMPAAVQPAPQAPAHHVKKSPVGTTPPTSAEARPVAPRVAATTAPTVTPGQPSVPLINAIVQHHASGQSPHNLAELIKRCTGSDPIEKALCLKAICQSAKADKASAGVCSS